MHRAHPLYLLLELGQAEAPLRDLRLQLALQRPQRSARALRKSEHLHAVLLGARVQRIHAFDPLHHVALVHLFEQLVGLLVVLARVSLGIRPASHLLVDGPLEIDDHLLPLSAGLVECSKHHAHPRTASFRQLDDRQLGLLVPPKRLEAVCRLELLVLSQARVDTVLDLGQDGLLLLLRRSRSL